MLDHLSEGRFEFGTGRGAGSHEILGFLPGMDDLSGTREIWEDVIGEFPKMWMQDTYEGYEGKFWSLPPRKILPKPYVKPHPPMWYAAGNTSSYEMTARKGLGVLGFSVQSLEECEAVMKVYKEAIATAEPVGAFVNDNIMITSAAYVRENARRSGEGGGRLADDLPPEQRVPVPRHVPASRLGARVARPHPRRRRGDRPGDDRHRRGAHRRPRRRARGVPAVGECRRRPARVRDRARHARGHARDRSGSSASTSSRRSTPIRSTAPTRCAPLRHRNGQGNRTPLSSGHREEQPMVASEQVRDLDARRPTPKARATRAALGQVGGRVLRRRRLRRGVGARPGAPLQAHERCDLWPLPEQGRSADRCDHRADRRRARGADCRANTSGWSTPSSRRRGRTDLARRCAR